MIKQRLHKKAHLLRTQTPFRDSRLGKMNWLVYLKPTVQLEDRVLPEKTVQTSYIYLHITQNSVSLTNLYKFTQNLFIWSLYFIKIKKKC